jgi:multiple sugar transport system permease protein
VDRSLSFGPVDDRRRQLLPEQVVDRELLGIFQTSEFTDALRNSIGIALITTVISVTVACMAAYAIARLNFPGEVLILTAASGGRDVPDLDRRAALQHLARGHL